jgi:hypothetical protein
MEFLLYKKLLKMQGFLFFAPYEGRIFILPSRMTLFFVSRRAYFFKEQPHDEQAPG